MDKNMPTGYRKDGTKIIPPYGWNKGKTGVYSAETLLRKSLSQKGKPRWTQEDKDRIRKQRIGTHASLEARQNMSKAHKGKSTAAWTPRGEKARLWKGGVSKLSGYMAWKNNRRRVRKNNAEGSHTIGEWELLKKQYGFKCPSCGKKELDIKLTQDHIIPLFKGGSDYIENIQPLCRSCNSKKFLQIKKYG